MDTHPPGVFQIDGNLGAANGMLEALLQSRWTAEGSELELLPALPTQWAEGSLHGVRVRGGATVDLAWAAGKLVSMQIHAQADSTLQLLLPKDQTIASVRLAGGGSNRAFNAGTLHMTKGSSYEIAFR